MKLERAGLGAAVSWSAAALCRFRLALIGREGESAAGSLIPGRDPPALPLLLDRGEGRGEESKEGRGAARKLSVESSMLDVRCSPDNAVPSLPFCASIKQIARGA
jgi:hypothetical protein